MTQEKIELHTETGELKVVNNNFFQVYKDNVDILINIGKENKTALNIFLWIAKHMDNRNALVVSQEAIAEKLGITTRTVRYAIAYLKEVKALEIFKSGTTNIYALNSKIVWQDDADKKKFAHFSAKVYISETEQEKNYKSQNFAHAIPVKERKKAFQTQIKL